MSVCRRLRVFFFLRKFEVIYLIGKRNTNEHLKRMIIINPVLEKRFISANHRLKLEILFFRDFGNHDVEKYVVDEIRFPKLRNHEIATC
jgi:hypothetical protein